MKTIIMTMVLLLSTYTFAREASDSSVADRIELRNEIRKNFQSKESKTESHCSSKELEEKLIGC